MRCSVITQIYRPKLTPLPHPSPRDM